MSLKPSKIIYPNQSMLIRNFKAFVAPHLKQIHSVEKALLWGSLANGSFGIYSKPYQGHIGSDIDLIVLLEKGSNVPKDFKYLEINKTWFRGYRPRNFGKFLCESIPHKIDILLVKSEYDERYVRERIKNLQRGKLIPIYTKRNLGEKTK
ncbi:MAG: hypothetical protein Q8P15_01715 [Nanoarchaeota archaeon]|nr:hypothetical protein [Nanoarchaeota archaeon]